MSVLVTGGAGYIGSHVVESLIQNGYSVLILDNFSTGHRSLVHPRSQLVQGDVRDLNLVSRILNENQIQSILHFAAFTGVSESLANPEQYYSNNFGGTLSLLRASVGSSVKSFVFSSTAAVYKDPGQGLVTEDSKTEPVTPYGWSKLMSERMIQDAARASGLKYMILRYFNVAGASASGQFGQYGCQSTVLIKRAALAAAGKLNSFSIFGTDYSTPDGTAIRDFIHVEDLADIHVASLRHLQAGGASDFLNCGYGHGFSVRNVVETMKKVSGRDFAVTEEGRRPGDLAQVVTSNEKLKSILKWSPKRDDLELICRSAYQWEIRS